MKDETTVLTAARDKKDKDVEKRLTRLEAMVRKLKANSEIHWGKDVDGDGTVGYVAVRLISILAVAIFGITALFAVAENRVVDWTRGVDAYSSAKAYVDITPGGTATLKVDRVEVPASGWVIGGTSVTASADSINSGVPSSTATLVSNANLKVYGRTVQIVAGGGITDAATSSNTLSGVTIISNSAAKAYVKDVEIVSGGTFTAPADSVSIDALNGITATAGEINATDVSASGTTNNPGLMYSVKGGYTFNAGSNLMTNQTLGVSVPDNAIVMAGIIDVVTPFISSNNNGTLAIDLRGGANILTAIDADTISATHTNSTDLRFEDAGTWIKTTSNTEVVIETATSHVTNGSFDVILFYTMGR